MVIAIYPFAFPPKEDHATTTTSSSSTASASLQYIPIMISLVKLSTSLQFLSSTASICIDQVTRSTWLSYHTAAFVTAISTKQNNLDANANTARSIANMSRSTAAFDESAITKALSLLDIVYGPITDNLTHFPLPMPPSEAGLCHDGYQRRYLWTDAFGVLAYTSIAEMYEMNNEKGKANTYHRACDKLINTVHECLGSPRSNAKDDAMKIDPSSTSPTGHVGLRIGKLHSRKVTDYGMEYDGQYWHYVDKWLLALARAGHVNEGLHIAKSCFSAFFDVDHGGIRWKLSVDSTAPPSLRYAGPSDDTLVALIVFSILEAARARVCGDDAPSLSDEIQMLKSALIGYKPRVTNDPLGWGLDSMYDQYLAGKPRTRMLASTHESALHLSHLSLPFRLYGAMIGARVAGEEVAPKAKVDRLIEMSLKYEGEIMERGHEEHSSINRVMLAMCLLCPGALGKRADDPTIIL